MTGPVPGIIRYGLALVVLILEIPSGTIHADDGRFQAASDAAQPGELPEELPLGHPVRIDRLRPIDELQIAPNTRQEVLPRDYAAERFDQEAALFQQVGTCRLWGDSTYAWAAPALCHGPLYFEDVNLERYGRTHGLAQPAVSAVHFGGRFAAWPYLMGAYPPHECIYTLGRQPPGTYSAYHWHRPPLSVRGALYQAGVVTGLTYLVP